MGGESLNEDFISSDFVKWFYTLHEPTNIFLIVLLLPFHGFRVAQCGIITCKNVMHYKLFLQELP
jgi:hypothetical protein